MITLMALLGCVKHFYPEPLAVSTRATVGLNAHRGEVVTENVCDAMILGAVFLGDERIAVEDLLAKSQAAGGDAVVDYRIENNRAFGFTFLLPFYMGQCWTVTGVSATLTPGVTPNTAPVEE
jgi:hypothetical protein